MNYFCYYLLGPPGIGGMNPRMNPPPRGPGMGPMGSYGPGMRGGPPNSNLGPSGGPIPPMIGAGGRPQWQPNTSTPMNYSSSSPGSYGVCLKLNELIEFRL